MKKEITTQQLIEVISTSISRKEAAIKLNISISTFRTKLKIAKIDFDMYCLKTERPAKQHPEIDKQWLIDNWLNTTKSIKQLADEFKVSDSLIESRITKYKLEKTFKHTINTEKLFNLLDPHVWYLAGLATTDGYFPKEQDACTFELVGEDEYNLLVAMKNYFESSQEVVIRERHDSYHKTNFYTNYWRLQALGLQKFFEANFKIALRDKTFKTDAPENFPNEDCAKAYIRGCIDGDGYLSKDSKTLQLCNASENFILGVQNIIKNYTNIEGIYSKAKRKNNKEFPMITYRTNKAKAVLT